MLNALSEPPAAGAATLLAAGVPRQVLGDGMCTS